MKLITNNIERVKSLALLHIALLIYSFCAVLMKTASSYIAFSFEFCLFYVYAVIVMGIYAILWQQVLKRNSLTVAFSNKAITVLWGMVLGNLFFKEAITWTMLVGSIIIVLGICVMVSGEKHE